MTHRHPNPDQTQVVVALIEKAIDPYNPNSSLELFFEISDLINLREENAREAFKTIRKELGVYKGKNWAVCLKILMLLEVCSNNCNKRFQINLANKEFLSELKFIIGPKLQPPIDIQEKILYLIQHWTVTFKNDNDFKPIEHAYNELRSKGVDFPVYNPELSVTNLTNTLKQTTPPRAAETAPVSGGGATAAATAAAVGGAQARPVQHRTPDQVAAPPVPINVVKLNEDQIAKLNSELDVVESNVHILNEILNEMQLSDKPKGATTTADDDFQLLQDLYKTCKEMQKRITQLIGSISNENIISELLRINDDLNNSFLRYERFERSVNFQKTQSDSSGASGGAAVAAAAVTSSAAAAAALTATASQPSANAASASASKAPEKSLIDFEDDDFDPLKTKKTTSQQSPLTNETSKSSDPSNQSSLFSKAPKPAEKSNSTDDPNFEKQMLAEENEIKEMEEWLKRQGLNENFNSTDDSTSKKEPPKHN